MERVALKAASAHQVIARRSAFPITSRLAENASFIAGQEGQPVRNQLPL